jgi:hypothetical protein
VKSFNGEQIANVFSESFGEQVDAAHIEKSQGMSTFRQFSTKYIVKTRSEFLSRYFEVAG